MSEPPQYVRKMPSLHQSIPIDEQAVKQKLLRVLRPLEWDHQTCNTYSAATCLDMAMDSMMVALALFDRDQSPQKAFRTSSTNLGVCSAHIGIPDLSNESVQILVIEFFQKLLQQDVEDSTKNQSKKSMDFAFRMLSLCEAGVELPLDLGQHWVHVEKDDLRWLLLLTRANCGPTIVWKRTDKGEPDDMPIGEKIEARFLKAQRLWDLRKRIH